MTLDHGCVGSVSGSCRPGPAPGAKVLRDWGGKVPSGPGEGANGDRSRSRVPRGGADSATCLRYIERCHGINWGWSLSPGTCPIPLWDENPALPGDSRHEPILCPPQVPWVSWGCTSCSAMALPSSATSSASSTPPTSRKYLSRHLESVPCPRLRVCLLREEAIMAGKLLRLSWKRWDCAGSGAGVPDGQVPSRVWRIWEGGAHPRAAAAASFPLPPQHQSHREQQQGG